MKTKIIVDHNVHPNNIIVCGRIGGCNYKNELQDAIHKIQNNRNLKILIADQPLVDQSKMKRNEWENDFNIFINSFSNYDTTIKFHPSTKSKMLETQKSILPNHISISNNNFITPEYLKKFDIVITYFSSIYTDCIEAGIPVVFYNFDHCDILFPEIKNSLLYNSYSIDDLIQKLNYTNINKTFIGNSVGGTLNSYIISDDAAQAIFNNILAFSNNNLATYKNTPHRCNIGFLQNQFCLEYSSITEENPKSICIIGDDFGTTSGVAYPILNYFKYMQVCSDSKIEFILVKRTMSANYIIEKAMNFSYIIINSLAFFFRYPKASTVIKNLGNKFIYVYAHETDFTIQYEKRNNSRNFNEFIKIAPDLFFLCVSRAQQKLFQSYGWRKTSVIYNCIDYIEDGKYDNLMHIKKKTVLMAGTIQDRKGIALFCKVADILTKEGYTFVWVGALTNKCTHKLSENVQFLGFKHRDQVLDLIKACEIFFLSSVDDPFPLSLLEAAAFNKKIVSYASVGSYEVFYNISGYQPFFRYNTVDACSAIRKIADLPHDKINTNTVSFYFYPLYFSMRLNIALKQYRYESKFNLEDNANKDKVQEQEANSCFINNKKQNSERALPYLNKASEFRKKGDFISAYLNYKKALSLNENSQSAKKFIAKNRIKIFILKLLRVLPKQL